MREAIIGVCGTLAGTLLGWLLQFIKTKRLYFSKIVIKPKTKDGFFKAYFELNIYNSSHYTRAIRNPRIIAYSDEKEVINEPIQDSSSFKTSSEKEEFEKYKHDLNIINLAAHGNIAQRCMIENWELNCNITKAILVYENEKFKQRKIKIIWKNEGKSNG